MIPVLQALVLAERVFEDKNGQKIIAGTFNVIHIKRPEPPMEKVNERGEMVRLVGPKVGSPYAFISLTDVCDNTILELQFVSLTRNQVLFETAITVHCKNRLESVEIVSALPPLDVPEPGIYAFEIVCEDEVIGSYRIVATSVDGDDSQDVPETS